jgi:Omp85 superfamily domain
MLNNACSIYNLKPAIFLRRIIIIISLVCKGLLFDSSYAQQEPVNWQATRKNSKDIIDVFRSLEKNKKPRIDSLAETVGKLHFSMVPAVGYTLSTGWAGILAGNVGFYTFDPRTTNLSSITTSIVYSQYSQLTVPLLMNLWSQNNKFNYVIDWRYYKYPQDTYGLGGHSSLANADLIDYSQIRIHQSVLREIVTNLYGGFGYFLDYHWNIKELGQADSAISDARRYGLTPKSVSSGLVANLLYDNRNNSLNPDGGLYANVLYRPNFKFLGSDKNWQSLTIDLRKYFKFPSGSNNILAIWNYDWLTIRGKPPYLDLPSTGWDAYNNTGRGYIQGRFRGKNMLYLETEYRFCLSRNGLFGGVVFANAQSFAEIQTNYYDDIWPAAGVGIRIKINKHSKANICIDYGFGADGSRGLFVNVGEVF